MGHRFLTLLCISAAALSASLASAGAQETGGTRLAHQFPLPDWADEDLSWLNDSTPYDASRASCASVKGREPPPHDWPLADEASALQGCDAFALYHGIGGPQDFAKARHCALLQREDMGRDHAANGITHFPVLDGSGVLAMLYANGAGVPRNLDVALHMACEMNGAAAEMDSRITALGEMRRAGWQGSDFDPCNHMTSGTGTSICLTGARRLDELAIDRRLEALSANWPPAQRQALHDVRQAFSAYSEAANRLNGFDAGGGWPGVWQQAGQSAMDAAFLQRLLAVAQRQALPNPAADEPEDERPWSHAATMTEARWQAMLAGLAPDDLPRFNDSRMASIAARRAFEPKLIAFLRLTRPDLTAHQVRVLFRDL
jgi:TPR repeat protein